MPRPRRMLKSGDAKQPVRAISTNPFLAIEVFAMKSPIELPQARTVSPRKVVGRPVRSARILSMSMRMFAKSQIQKTLMKKEKPSSARRKTPWLGGFDVFVRNLIATEPQRVRTNRIYYVSDSNSSNSRKFIAELLTLGARDDQQEATGW